MTSQTLIAEGPSVLERLKQLYVNGQLQHRVTNRLKMISMSIQLNTRKPVSLELKLARNGTLPPIYYLEIDCYFADGSGRAVTQPSIIEMQANQDGLITHVSC